MKISLALGDSKRFECVGSHPQRTVRKNYSAKPTRLRLLSRTSPHARSPRERASFARGDGEKLIQIKYKVSTRQISILHLRARFVIYSLSLEAKFVCISRFQKQQSFGRPRAHSKAASDKRPNTIQSRKNVAHVHSFFYVYLYFFTSRLFRPTLAAPLRSRTDEPPANKTRHGCRVSYRQGG